ncbi:hypothetical protein HPP92_002506 [Vanilla planifolia]|uniref:UBX domain-containing protein n=1 Tax=Vanilla planifolia TaxID=51239 RepID=A0A835VJ08_VANPL|nr:hypothetical protein HPP92_002869 [Vanilla planifolia]KAG0502434.1 hypothetical protein HPP92_002506 [Vanilla planifolia]
MMERPTASLTYKGSISEAIIEAQNQKKLFLVYISGEDENSTNLENSTWVDERVAEAVSRYCIFLHLIEGHIEALQFSSIYPQKSIPSISAVGYNGVMLWQNEGYIKAENFVECIEKSWAAMHFQDTAAALLTAALTSKEPGHPSSGNSDVGPSEQGVYPDMPDPSSSADHSHVAEVALSNDPKAELGKQVEDIVNDESTEILHSVTQNTQILENASHENLPAESHSSSSPKSGSSQINANEVHEGAVAVPDENMERESTKNSTEIFLAIRMPSGISLQAKFTITDTLRSVKNYVDHNQGSSQSSYDLAIPYPRAVFVEEDMSKSLGELGISGRQAMIVIPRQQAQMPLRGLSSSNEVHVPTTQTNTTIGYFGYLKRVLSYMNPFSYFAPIGGGASRSEQAPNEPWQYRANPGLRSSLLRENEHHPYSSNLYNSSLVPDASSSSGRPSRPFGSNIHTLRHR